MNTLFLLIFHRKKILEQLLLVLLGAKCRKKNGAYAKAFSLQIVLNPQYEDFKCTSV